MTAHHWRHNAVSMACDLLIAGDVLCLFIAAALATNALGPNLHFAGLSLGAGGYGVRAILVALVLAPVILFEKRFCRAARRGRTTTLVVGHILRFVIFAGAICLFDAASGVLADAPHGWLLQWLATALLLTTLERVLLALTVRHLQRSGAIADAVAIVGSGPLARRLVNSLQRNIVSKGESARRSDWNVELLGVFDDGPADSTPFDEGDAQWRPGTLAELIMLGQKRRIDLIVIAMPYSEIERADAAVQYLKSLSVPIARCPQNPNIELAAPHGFRPEAGDALALLGDRRTARSDSLLGNLRDCLPRWVMTFGSLGQSAIDPMRDYLYRGNADRADPALDDAQAQAPRDPTLSSK